MADNNGTIDPNTGMGNGGVGGFLSSLLGGYNTQRNEAQAYKHNQAIDENNSRTFAKQQYDANVNVARERLDLLTNPQFIKRQQDLAKQAGLPDPAQMTPGAPATPGTPAQAAVPGSPAQAATPGVSGAQNIGNPNNAAPGAAPPPPAAPQFSDVQLAAAQHQLQQLQAQVAKNPGLARDPNVTAQAQRLQSVINAPRTPQQGSQQGPQGAQQPQVSPAQRQAAQQQLTQIATAVKADPSKQTPELARHVQALQKIAAAPQPQQQPGQQPLVAGVGQMGRSDTTDTAQRAKAAVPGQAAVAPQAAIPAVPGTPQGMPRETFDINSMAPRPDLHSPDMEKQNEYAGTLPPGAIRDRFLQGFSGVSQADREAPAIATQQDKTQVGKDFMQIMTNVGKGVYKGPMAIAQIRSIVPKAMAAGYDPEDLITALQDDAEVGPATQASMDKARAAGMSDKALAAYHTMLTVDKPKWMADQIRQAEQKIDISGENATTNRMNAGSRAISANAAATSAAAKASDAQVTADNAVARTTALTKTADARMMDAQTHVRANNLAQARADTVSLNTLRSSLNTEYNTISRQVDTMITNQKNPNEAGSDIPDPANPGQTIPGPSLLDKQKAVKDKLDELTGVIGTTQAAITNGPTTAVRNSMGNGSAVIGKQPQLPTPPQGYKIVGSSKDKDGYYTVTDGSRTRQWKP